MYSVVGHFTVPRLNSGCSTTATSQGSSEWLGLFFQCEGEREGNSTQLCINTSFSVYPEMIGCKLKLFGSWCNTPDSTPSTIFEAASYNLISQPRACKLMNRETLIKQSSHSKSDQSSSSLKVEGKIIRMSPVYRYRNVGNSVFLEVEVTSRSSLDMDMTIPIKVVLVNHAVLLRPYLHLDEMYSISLLKKMRDSPGCSFSQPSMSQQCGAAISYWYLLEESERGTTTTISKLQEMPSFAGSSSCLTPARSDSCSRALLQLNAAHQPLPMDWILPLRFMDASQAEIARRMYTEVDIVGIVDTFHSSGWIELRTTIITNGAIRGDMRVGTPTTSAAGSINLCIFLAHRPRSDIDVSCRPGAIVSLSSVLPVYLWDGLRGFAATSRTHMRILAFGTAGSGSRTAQRLSVSKSLLGRCHVYLAWKVVVMRSVESALACGSSDAVLRVIEHSIELRHEHLGSPNNQGSSASIPRITDLTTLPTPHVAKVEFSDPHTAELFSVRAGNDIDVINAVLPKVWSCTALGEYVDSMIDNVREIRAMDVLYVVSKHPTTYCYQGFGRPVPPQTKQSDGSQLSARLSLPNVNQNVEIVGTVMSVLLLPVSGVSKESLLVHVLLHDSHGISAHALVSAQKGDQFLSDLAAWIELTTPAPLSGNTAFSTNQRKRDTTSNPCTLAHALGRVNFSGPSRPVLILHNPAMIIEEPPGDSFHRAKYMMLASGKDVSLEGFFNLEVLDDAVAMRESSVEPAIIKDAALSMSGAEGSRLDEIASKENQGMRSQTDAAHLNGRDNVPPSAEMANLKRKRTSEPHRRPSHRNADAFERMSGHFSSPQGLMASINAASCSDRVSCLNDNSFTALQTTSLPSESNHLIWQRPTSSVRHALLCPETAKRRLIPWSEVVGVVMLKEINANQSKQQYSIYLRDTSSADTIMVCAPSAIGEMLHIGLVISLQRTSLSISEGGRSYIIFEPDSVVGVVGVSPLDQLTHFCVQSSMASRDGRLSRGIALASNVVNKNYPRSTISMLYSSQQYNRCLWTLVARMVYVKKVNIYLQCKQCSQPAVRRMGTVQGPAWVCKVCQMSAYLGAVWSAVVVVDDGSSECLVYADGAATCLELVKPPSRAKAKDVASRAGRWIGGPESRTMGTEAGALSREEIQEACEEACMIHGKVQFDHEISQRERAEAWAAAKAKSGNQSTAAAGVSVEEADEMSMHYLDPQEVAEQAARFARIQKQRPALATERLLEQYVQCCDIASQIELGVRVIFKHGSLGKEFNTFNRKILLQEANPDRLWCNYMLPCYTRSTNNLSLQATHALTISASRSLARGEAWKQLEAFQRLQG